MSTAIYCIIILVHVKVDDRILIHIFNNIQFDLREDWGQRNKYQQQPCISCIKFFYTSFLFFLATVILHVSFLQSHCIYQPLSLSPIHQTYIVTILLVNYFLLFTESYNLLLISYFLIYLFCPLHRLEEQKNTCTCAVFLFIPQILIFCLLLKIITTQRL